VIAERVGVRVVSDFRSRDVAAGGQGAPLVPVADVMLFGHPERGRLLLNLGGMANITWVPRRGVIDGAVAFDTGPGVAVIDAVTVGRGMERWSPPLPPGAGDEPVISGGGARNPALVELLAGRVRPRPVVPFDQLFFDGEAKEALAFAFLGFLTLAGKPGNLPA